MFSPIAASSRTAKTAHIDIGPFVYLTGFFEPHFGVALQHRQARVYISPHAVRRTPSPMDSRLHWQRLHVGRWLQGGVAANEGLPDADAPSRYLPDFGVRTGANHVNGYVYSE